MLVFILSFHIIRVEVITQYGSYIRQYHWDRTFFDIVVVTSGTRLSHLYLTVVTGGTELSRRTLPLGRICPT